MRYRTPAALEMAVKAEAKASPVDTNKAIAGFYFDRLLCRIFSEDDPSFVLKGGQSMIARTVSARTTKDIDLLSHAIDTGEALDELKRLASIDLEDFITYSFVRAIPIKAEEEYREGLKVFFAPRLGTSARDDISIDLVVDQVVCDDPDSMSPLGRLDVGDLEVHDYLLYPVVCAMADKICATMQVFEGRESSRVKDLVDLAILVTTQAFDADTLRSRIALEAALRKMGTIGSLIVPPSWFTMRRATYSKLAGETGLDQRYHDVEAASELVSGCVDPLLAGQVKGISWNPEALCWG